MPDPTRKYTEEEIAALLKRTAELQADDARNEQHSSQGLSLAELEDIAADAGLDAAYLHQAALEIESSGKKGFEKRTKTHIRVQRFLSTELDEDLWEEMVFELRRTFGSSSHIDMSGLGAFGMGTVEQIGRSREWRHTSAMGVQTSVLARPHKGGTRIELSQMVGLGSPRTEAIGYGMFLAMIPAFIAAVAAGKSLTVGIIAFLVSLLACVPLVYRLDTGWREKKLAGLEDAADLLVGLSSSRIIPAAVSAEATAHAEHDETIRESRAVDLLDSATDPLEEDAQLVRPKNRTSG